jgi:hypothetical protein
MRSNFIIVLLPIRNSGTWVPSKIECGWSVRGLAVEGTPLHCKCMLDREIEWWWRLIATDVSGRQDYGRQAQLQGNRAGRISDRNDIGHPLNLNPREGASNIITAHFTVVKGFHIFGFRYDYT